MQEELLMLFHGEKSNKVHLGEGDAVILETFNKMINKMIEVIILQNFLAKIFVYVGKFP